MFRHRLQTLQSSLCRRKNRRRTNTLVTAACALELLENRTLLAAAFPEFVDPNPSVGNGFGTEIVPLSTGNVVVTSPFADVGGTDTGAVYLFNGASGVLVSSLTGSQGGDQVGNGGVVVLANGNFVVASPTWSHEGLQRVGAVTFASGSTGISGVVSADNSLIGSIEHQTVGAAVSGGTSRPDVAGVVPLPNGDYVVTNENTSNGATADVGSVTHANGVTGTTGVISAANSLLGAVSFDRIGNGGITILANGNYVISSPTRDGNDQTNTGALTFANGDTGIMGVLDETNSLVGSRHLAELERVVALTNGNYVVHQPSWRNTVGDTVGAVMLVDGTTGATGFIDPAKSLIGSTHGDRVGLSSRGGNSLITPLVNGNYVVASPEWNHGSLDRAGAATWQNGTTATGTVVSAENSLVGGSGVRFIGSGGVIALSNGNAVVSSGSVTTFMNGTTGRSGIVSVENSLQFNQGTTTKRSDVTALPNGNYIVASYGENRVTDNEYGALTLVDGNTGRHGGIFFGNSLVNIIPKPPELFENDQILVLPNSNYVQKLMGGGLYFGSGTIPPTGQFSDDQDLDTQSPNAFPVALTNGNFVVVDADLETSVTSNFLVDGASGLTGALPEAARIEGSPGIALNNDNYVLRREGDVIIADGKNPGVSVSATFEVLRDGSSGPFPVSENGSFVLLNHSHDLGDIQNVGSIVFIGGSPDFSAGTVTSTFLVGTTENRGFGDPVVDSVNEQFYFRMTDGEFNRVLAGSTIDGFANPEVGPEVNLSVSANAASEAEETEITVTATTNAAVSGRQTVVVVASGTAGDIDFDFSGRSITIPDGQTTGSLTVTIRSDYLREGAESLNLTLANPSSGIRLGLTTEQSILIEDDTTKHLSLNPVPHLPTDRTPTFTWNDVGADRYEVWLERTSPLPSPGSGLRLQQESRFVIGTSYTSTEVLTAGVYLF